VVVSARFLVRLASAAAVLGFFAWLWSKGAIAPGSLGWLRVIPLFLLGFLAFEVIAHAVESALDTARDSHTVRPEPVEGPSFFREEKKGRASTGSVRTDSVSGPSR
jgi:hypothetical protein